MISVLPSLAWDTRDTIFGLALSPKNIILSRTLGP